MTKVHDSAKLGRPVWLILTIALLLLPIGIPLGSSQAQSDSQPFLYGDLALVLKTYVDDNGMVDYKQLKAHS